MEQSSGKETSFQGLIRKIKSGKYKRARKRRGYARMKRQLRQIKKRPVTDKAWRRHRRRTAKYETAKLNRSLKRRR